MKSEKTYSSDWIKNIVNEDFLKDNLTFVSLFIAVYENFVENVVSKIKTFLCVEEIKDGNLIYNETKKYKDEICNRIVDEKGNKNITKSSFLWLVDNGAVTQADYSDFLSIKMIRNKYAHELTEIILYGVEENEIKLFFDMIALYKKITEWWFLNIEAEIMGYKIEEGAEIQGSANMVFDIIIQILYNGKSKEYQQIISKHMSQ